MKPQRSCVVVLGLLLAAGLTGSANKPGVVVDEEQTVAGQPEATWKATKPITVDAAEKDTASESTAGPSTGKDAPPAKPDATVIAAWEKAGAKFGWGGAVELGAFGLMTGPLIPRAGDTPGFAFTSGGRLSQSLQGLPPPGIPFAVISSNADDAAVKDLAGLKQLRSLTLSVPNVTDVGLKELAELKQLQSLVLHGPNVTDVALKELAGLKQLQSLELWNPTVTDAGLKDLAGLEQLQSLTIYGCSKVTDVGFKELAGLKQLESLRLDVCFNMTDAGFKELAGLKQLQSLRLRNTQITDAGLQYIEGLTSLQLLDLLGAPITDAGLVHLKGLTRLEHLLILETQVTDEGVKNFQLALPNCKIIR